MQTITDNGYTPEFCREKADNMVLMFGRAQATARLQDRINNWKGDTRRDGDTPKRAWEMMLSHVKASA